MGWKIILPPTFLWPEFRLPSEKVRSNSVNRAQTSEIGFESFLPVSATSPCSGAVTPPPGWTRGSCPRAAVAKKTRASSSADGTTACRPTLALRIAVCSFMPTSLFLSTSKSLCNYATSPAVAIALPIPHAALVTTAPLSFKTSIFNPPKMPAEVGRLAC